ncbi:penicillin acylase family protein [Terriglobus tenax]|uniref:penicillin acylase family protein n=1 Tax=Terriglobus tenax TaxID=1111115 RepID=UPI0021E0261B|nr:penicillin acylase family protein [Terriglobus tenax]
MSATAWAQYPQPVPINLQQTTPQKVLTVARENLPETSGMLLVKGVKQSVRVARDQYGVAHIYAQNTADLFFAQGYTAAQDRMWQLEMWRRIGEGRLAEVLGSQYAERDRFARTLQFRGDLQKEMTKYHPEGQLIFESFARGVNAAIIDMLESGKLPVEFRLMGFNPEPVWTATTLLNRMVAWNLTRNVSSEVARALALKKGSPADVGSAFVTEPSHKIVVPEGLDLNDITPEILNIARNASDLHWKLQSDPAKPVAPAMGALTSDQQKLVDQTLAALTEQIANNSDLGSNNWVIGGAKSTTGMPLLANDPHREVVNPSLRSFVHLVAPGWNVIGATEPGLPGVSVGHNENIAWGFTILGVDQEDLYVEETNPKNTAYLYRGKWVPFTVDRQLIRVKGKLFPEIYDVKSTQHGPLLYLDTQRHRAYALKWVGSMPGGAGYLGSLNVMQARNWDEFTKAVAKSWYLPSHSLVYADVQGNYGYIAAAASPVRTGWDGLLPVPGKDGKYEWQGIEPLESLPRELNGKLGYYASANNDVVSRYFPASRSSLGYEYSAPYRFDRITEVLSQKRKFSLEEMEHLQFDHKSMVAAKLVPMLRGVRGTTAAEQDALETMLRWNNDVAMDSVAATLYEFWYYKLADMVYGDKLPAALKSEIRGTDPRRVIVWLSQEKDTVKRNRLLLEALDAALAEIHKRFGADRTAWTWGKVHKAELRHPLQNDKTGLVFYVDPVPRGGDAFTVQATSNVSADGSDEQHGASAMFVLDPQDWDRSVALNTPGNTANGGSVHSSDLAERWGIGAYFPLAFTRARVDAITEETMTLTPYSEAESKEKGAAFERVQTETLNIPAAVTIVFGDYDGDGWPDMYVGYRSEMNRLYHNDHGKFVDVTLSSGIIDTNEVRSAAWGDYNGDGLLDLYVGFGMNSTVPNRLYRNDGNGHFTEVALESGLYDTGESRQVSFVDYDNDGLVDLAVAFREKANKVYHNDGNGHFRDATENTGLGDPRKTIAGVWFDYNQSGFLSLFEANQNGDANGFYVNDGKGHFADKAKELGVAAENRGSNFGSVGLGVIDVNNDGKLDVFAANYGPAWLLMNDGTKFHDVAPSVGLGISAHLVATGWGDYDNDGKPDLYADGYLSGHENIRDYLWHNDGGIFTDVTPGYMLKHDADHAVVWVDFDNDGALDLALADHEREGGVNLYRNLLPVAAPGRSLAVLVLDAQGHYTRPGAEVKVYRAGSQELLGYQLVDTGSSYSSQSALPLYFGFPQPVLVDVEVINLTGEGRRSTWIRNVNPADYKGKWLRVKAQ